MKRNSIKTGTVKSRLDIIIPLIKDKNVLDIGCVDHDISQKDKEANWLHKKNSQYARYVEGVDTEKGAVKALNKAGFSITCGDIETVSLNKKFNIAVAGEIIEHLVNPQKCLTNIYRHLEPGGILIITTPNPFFIGQFFRILKRNSIKVRHDHTAWYDPQTLGALLQKSQFSVRECYWIKPAKKRILQYLCTFFRPYFSPAFLLVAYKNM